ncbi:glutamate ABC transporter substrate-binding protein [Nocardia sp. CA-128927]|uniref:glutamate ABC transporter substrate-binding protein n=1 Tax=Nocardia sp. CA-128927 TaxID=3239975 RepID=UPI003D976431
MKRVILTAALAASLVLGTACAKNNDKSPHFTIGIKYDQPGLSVMGADGTPQGFDVDTAIYIAKNLGVQPADIIWKEAQSGRREELLSSGAVDFVVASYSITAYRQKQVSFAGPYLTTGQDLIVRQDEVGIDRPEALGGRTVCTATGSTSADKIKKDFASDAKLTTRDTYSACIDDLLAGTVDAVTTDDVILAGFAAAHPGRLRVVGHPFSRERYGVGVKKGNVDLQRRITTAIQAMIGDGSWQRSMDAAIKPSGYQSAPPPPLFNAPDAPIATGDSTTLSPDLVKTANAVVDMATAQNWESLQKLVCPELQDAVGQQITQYAPQYDKNLGPDAKEVSFIISVTGISQTGPDSATFLAHETFDNVPEKYKHYFKDIDYTAKMVRRDGEWKMCGLASDFVES